MGLFVDGFGARYLRTNALPSEVLIGIVWVAGTPQSGNLTLPKECLAVILGNYLGERNYLKSHLPPIRETIYWLLLLRGEPFQFYGLLHPCAFCTVESPKFTCCPSEALRSQIDPTRILRRDLLLGWLQMNLRIWSLESSFKDSRGHNHLRKAWRLAVTKIYELFEGVVWWVIDTFSLFKRKCWAILYLKTQYILTWNDRT